MKILSERALEQIYDEYLDAVYDKVDICGYTYMASDALKEVDRVAYDEGLSNWVDEEVSEGRLVDNGEGDYAFPP